MIRFLRGLWPHARPPRTSAELEQQARDRRAAEAAAARQQREAEAEAWTEQQRRAEAAAAAAAAEEAQRQSAEFEAMVKGVRCYFPGDAVERRDSGNRLRGGRESLIERIFGGWSR